MARHHPRILGCVVKGLSGASTAAEQPTATATRSALFLGNWRRFLARTRGMLKSDGWVLLEWDDNDAHEPLTDLLARSPPVAAVIGGPEAVAVVARLADPRLLQVPFTGVDWLDPGALPRGCAAANVHGMDQPIAEYVLGTMLDSAVGFSSLNAEFKSDGIFRPPFPRNDGYKGRPFHNEIGGKTLGIVGLGSIGLQVAKRAKAFDMTVLATTRTARPQIPPNVDWAGTGVGTDLDKLLAASDFVLLTCPLTPETQNLFDASRLAKMKEGSILINVARGGVVDEQALYDALIEKKTVVGSIIDVWWGSHETGNPSLLGLEWQELPNVVMTPHASGWTEAGAESRRIQEIAANLDALAGFGALVNVVHEG